MRRASAQALYTNRAARSLHNLPVRRRSLRLDHIFLVALLALFVLCSFALSLCWNFLFPESPPIASSGRGLQPLRIAFGSSSSHDYSSQPVWVRGIIPADPHAWIWLGNMAYLDEARVDCEASPNHAQCNCSADWLRQPPHFCMTGDLKHAASKMQTQLANPDYAQFLAFMCPGHRAKGLFPPTGSDPAVCPRSIFGTYDDHDYGWRHGDRRLPLKDELKQIFLDAVGESQDSPRRSKDRGIQWKYTMNQDNQEIDVILLDTRYYRDPLPCHAMKSLCDGEKELSWCDDFRNRCCDKDDQQLNGDFCEVLGDEQRKWLENALLRSNSPLKLLVSSSAVLQADEQPADAPCSGDGWDCYKAAQRNLLELVKETPGCVIILSGGLQEPRIRALNSSSRTKYGGLSFSRTLYQIVSGGLSSKSVRCDGSKDHPECHEPSFGVIEVDGGIVKLQIRDGMTSEIKLQTAFSLASCSEASI